MAKKTAPKFICSNCGSSFATWMGKCTTCGEWNTLLEHSGSGTNIASSGKKLVPKKLPEVAAKDLAVRYQTGMDEIDTILGGGLVRGSVILIAGQPGIGKSTLLLQLSAALADKRPVMYVSGEESAHQVALRAERLGIMSGYLQLATSNSANDITASVAGGEFDVVIVDSIQTLAVAEVATAAGSVSQITNSAQLLMNAAKQSNTVLILVGHVTKEGTIAGPKVLEHVVDVVLQLEGDRYGGFKVLRSSKNRYGSTQETSILEMTDKGLLPVVNPSAQLLAERQVSDGSIVLATIEGNRPLLVEVQALVNPTSYGYPKRTASGLDLNRVNLLVAMLERRTKLRLSDQDIYVNIVGGIKINEPAADLAVCMAIASAAKGMSLKTDAVVFGEVGLSGEVRHVPYPEKRLAEARKLGFSAAIGPKSSAVSAKTDKTYLIKVADVRAALNHFLTKD